MSNAHTIAAFVAGAGKPRVVSLADDIHIFHFEADDNWRQACMLLVNRNGNFFRVLKRDDGKFELVKTWKGLFDDDGWMATNVKRDDPVSLIQICGVGEQRTDPKILREGLSLLPKDATTGGRKVAWRHHIIETRFLRETNACALRNPITGEFSEGFPGKIWESREAVAWCVDKLPGKPTAYEYVGATAYGQVDPARAPDPMKEAAIERVLEDSGMWGMF